MFDMLSKMYADMTERFADMTEQFKEINRKLDSKADKSDIIRLENELNPKVEVLFDGYTQHTEILERIEKEITKQDEFIMRRIK